MAPSLISRLAAKVARRTNWYNHTKYDTHGRGCGFSAYTAFWPELTLPLLPLVGLIKLTTWLKGPAVAPSALAGAGGAGAGAGGGASVPDAEAQAAAKAAAAAASAAEKAEAQAKKEAKQARHRAAGAWEGGMCSTALPRSRTPPPPPPTHHTTPVFARHKVRGQTQETQRAFFR